MTFQQLILNLNQFWQKQGCLLWQPYDIEKGAGTFNPATFLKVLDPEPWKVAYVEPSRRPADGRYGQNPNRLRLHYQYQVIIKPPSENIQEIYLDSLKEIGINPLKHDIKFLEDDWESPTLGAWGLGWEVRLDGMEITQFTYFQQAGGITLNPVSVELTYGLERIAMCIQKVDNVFEVLWNSQLKYKDMHLESEIQYSQYNFELIDISQQIKLFQIYEKEAKRMYNLIVDLNKKGFDPFEENSYTGIEMLNSIKCSKYLGIDMPVMNHLAAEYFYGLGFLSLYSSTFYPKRIGELSLQPFYQ